MYLDFFGLDTEPFRITPDIGFFFDGANRGPILEALIYAICHGEGVVKVTGEVGSGKTLLCRMLEQRLPEQVKVIYFANPSLPADELIAAIADELQLPVQDLGAGGRSQPLLQKVQHYLIDQFQQGKRTVLFVEEAQAMPLQTLEQIRLLSNLETSKDKLLQIVLFGQPELDQLLLEYQIRPLRERITHSFNLSPLSAQETEKYLERRLEIAGYRGATLFPANICKRMQVQTKGLIRRVNILADKTLLAAFAEQTRAVSPQLVSKAAADCQFGNSNLCQGYNRPWILIVSASALLGILALAWLYGDARWPSKMVTETIPHEENKLALPGPDPAGSNAALPIAAGVSEPISPQRPRSQPVALAQGRGHPETPAIEDKPAIENRPQNRAGLPDQPTLPSLLAERLELTKIWLANNKNTGYSMQIMTIWPEDIGNLERFLLRVKTTNVNLLDQLHIFRDQSQNKGWYSVTYGHYPDKKQALDETDTLAKLFRINSPFLRSLQGMRSAAGLIEQTPVAATHPPAFNKTTKIGTTQDVNH